MRMTAKRAACILTCTLIVSLPAGNFTHAEDSGLRNEALRDLSELDCEIDRLRPEIQILRGAVKRNIAEMNSIVTDNRKVVTDAENLAMEQLNDLAMEPVDAYLDEVSEDGAQAAVKVAGKLVGKAYGEATVFLSKRLLTAIFQMEQLNEMIGKASEVAELLHASNNLKAAQMRIIRAGRDMEENSASFDAATSLLKQLLSSRDSTIKKYEYRGLIVDAEILSSTCKVFSNGFDGVWAINDQPNADHVEIKGNKFRYVSISIDNVVKNCGKPLGNFTLMTDDQAVGKFSIKCNEGSSFAGVLSVTKAEAGLMGALCLQISGGGGANSLGDTCDLPPEEFVKLPK